MARTYQVDSWTDSLDFLSKVAQRSGKLLKGGEPDVNTISKMVLNDWVRGKIPFYTMPPGCRVPGEEGDAADADVVATATAEVEEQVEEVFLVPFFCFFVSNHPLVCGIETTRTGSSTTAYQEYQSDC